MKSAVLHFYPECGMVSGAPGVLSLPRRIICLSVGKFIGGFITSEGAAYWFRVENGKMENAALLLGVNKSTDVKACGISCGDNFLIFWTNKGEAYGFGDNTYGQLGCNFIGNVGPEGRNTWNSARKVHCDDLIYEASCGKYHTLFISANWGLYSSGKNSQGCLGFDHRETPQICVPTFVKIGARLPVSKCAAGDEHSVVLTSSGAIWSFGNNSTGQLGLTDMRSRQTPNLVESAIKSGCGPFSYLSAGAGTCGVTMDGQVYHWGVGLSTPTKFDIISGYRAVKVDYGGTKFCVLTEDGSVFVRHSREDDNTSEVRQLDETTTQFNYENITMSEDLLLCSSLHGHLTETNNSRSPYSVKRKSAPSPSNPAIQRQQYNPRPPPRATTSQYSSASREMSHPPSAGLYQPYRTPPKTDFQISTPTEEEGDGSSDDSDSSEQESTRSGISQTRRVPQTPVSPHIAYPSKSRKENVLVGASAPPMLAEASFTPDPKGPHSSIGREYGSWTAGGVRDRVGKCLEEYSTTKGAKEESQKKKEIEARLRPLIIDELKDLMEIQKQLGLETGPFQEANGDLDSVIRLLSDKSSNFRRQVLRLNQDLVSENRRQKEENSRIDEIHNSSQMTIDTLNQKIKELGEYSIEKEDNISSLESKLRRLTNQTSDDEKEIKKLTKEVDEVQRRNTKLQLDVESWSKKDCEVQEQIDNLESFKKVTLEESWMWKENETKLTSEIQKLEIELSALKEKNEILMTRSKENFDFQKQVQELQTQNSNLSVEIQDLNEKNKDLEGINQEFAQEVQDLKRQKEETEETFESNEALKEEIENLDNKRIKIQASFEQFIDYFQIEIPEELTELEVELEILYLEETRKFVEDMLEESSYRMEELECAQLQNKIKQQRIQQLEMRKENVPQRGNTTGRSRSSAASPKVSPKPSSRFKDNQMEEHSESQCLDERRSQPTSQPRGEKCKSFPKNTSGTSLLAEKFLSVESLRPKSRVTTPALTPQTVKRNFLDRKPAAIYFQKNR